LLRGADQLSATGGSTTRWILISHSHLWRPPTDVYETDEAFVIQVEVAGMTSADFGIVVQERRVTIHGVRHDPGEARAYHQMEIHFGEFRTDVELPGRFEREAVTAAYQDGYLKVVLPKPKPHRVDVT
jgi:HSP20 family protein